MTSSGVDLPRSEGGLFDRLARKLDTKIAPVIAPYMPEHYHGVYLRNLIQTA